MGVAASSRRAVPPHRVDSRAAPRSRSPTRYASLFFVAGISKADNELLTLEIIHQYVEVLDRYFGNVCELDIIFNFHKVSRRGGWLPGARRRPNDGTTRHGAPPLPPQAYYILDEIILGGELQETNKREVLRVCAAQDDMMDSEDSAIHRR